MANILTATALPNTVLSVGEQLLANQPDRSIWYTGESRSGKTQRLVDTALAWLPQLAPAQQLLLLAANDENKQGLHERISLATAGRYPIRVQTPLGFLQEQVHLFYPWIAQVANLPGVTPIRLRPETEQALATRLWQPDLQMQSWQSLGVSEYRLVRRLLDLMQLAANGLIEVADISDKLQLGYGQNDLFPWMGELIVTWQAWCLERGFLTYGLSTDLFWRYLWNHPQYRAYFADRYVAVVADDVDDYPAVIYPVLESFLNAPESKIAISYNPHGQIQLGLKSDPQQLLKLRQRCIEETLLPIAPALQPAGNLLNDIVTTVNDPSYWLTLPSNIQEISRRTRGEMLRAVVEKIATSIAANQIQAQDIVIVVPGLDNIARYTLTETLVARGITVKALNDQRPLYSSPAVRSILTILALSLPGLGRTIGRDRVAEMLVELSSYRLPGGKLAQAIDPVRAGLLADHCYSPNADKPELQPLESFPRWDRLGAKAAASYRRIWHWVQSPPTNALGIMDGAIGEFCERGELLTFDRLTALRALMEAAQHYWQVMQRVDEQDPESSLAEQFIVLLQQGTVTANPYPVSHLGAAEQGVTLANIFQYRSSKKTHRWHFWLDVGSELWAKGGSASLYGSQCFLQDWDGQPINAETEELLDRQRLERVLRDLLQRVEDRLYLCNSDLAVNGQDQVGPLLTLISRITPEPSISAAGIETHAF
jgi:hypothetical protein